MAHHCSDSKDYHTRRERSQICPDIHRHRRQASSWTVDRVIIPGSSVRAFAKFNSSMLRPHRFGKHKGILFNVQVTVSEGPDFKGVSRAIVVNEKLYLLIYLGAEPYYCEKNLQKAMEIIKSSRVGNEA